jgi:hypothetical protein
MSSGSSQKSNAKSRRERSPKVISSRAGAEYAAAASEANSASTVYL